MLQLQLLIGFNFLLLIEVLEDSAHRLLVVFSHLVTAWYIERCVGVDGRTSTHWRTPTNILILHISMQ